MAKNFKEGGLQLDSVEYISRDNFTRFFRENSYIPTVPRTGDVLVSIIGTLGEPYVVRPDDEFALSSSVAILRPDTTLVLPGYLYNWMRGPQFQDSVFGIKGGVAQSYVSLGMIKSLPLLCPSIEVQSKILTILSAYDDLIENNNRRIRILENMAQRIYREWFVDFRYPGHESIPMVDSELGPIPRGWEVRRLGHVCKVMQSGGTPSRANPAYWREGAIDWFTTTELVDGFLAGSREQVTDAALANRKTRLFDVGTILMAIYGSPTVGRLGVLTRAAACNQAALAMVAHEGLLPQPLLYYALQGLRTHFNSIAQGAAQQNISKAKVDEALIVVPDREIACLCAEHIGDLWGLRKALTASLSTLRTTRDLLLPRLISGTIDVEDLDIAMPDVTA